MAAFLSTTSEDCRKSDGKWGPRKGNGRNLCAFVAFFQVDENDPSGMKQGVFESIQTAPKSCKFKRVTTNF